MHSKECLCSFARSTAVTPSSLFLQCQFSSSLLLLVQFQMSDGSHFLCFDYSIRFPCLMLILNYYYT